MADSSITSLAYYQSLYSDITSSTTSSSTMTSIDFLELLLVQLENQDPTEPTDTNQLTEQLCSFNQLEQQTQTNAYLADLLGYQAALMNAQATQILGQEVVVEGDTCSVSSGESQDLIFELSEDASSLSIKIYDEDGELVREIELEDMTAGKHEFQWEPVDEDGNNLPDGTYTFSVTGTNSDGDSIEATTYSSYKVAEVEYKDGDLTLITEDGSELLYSQVASIRLAD